MPLNTHKCKRARMIAAQDCHLVYLFTNYAAVSTSNTPLNIWSLGVEDKTLIDILAVIYKKTTNSPHPFCLAHTSQMDRLHSIQKAVAVSVTIFIACHILQKAMCSDVLDYAFFSDHTTLCWSVFTIVYVVWEIGF